MLVPENECEFTAQLMKTLRAEVFVEVKRDLAIRARPQPVSGLLESALRRYFPAMKDATVTRSLVMREAEATFASDPEAEGLRPGTRTSVTGLYLAGDWTATGLPATIEGAVRSGNAAARAVEAGT